MKELTNLSPFHWIKDALPTPKSSKDEDWNGNFLSNYLPNSFEAYCKIFHPIFTDLTIKDEKLTWDRFEKENGDLEEDPLKEVLSDALAIRGTEIDLLISRRILWKALLNKYGLKFHPEVNGNSLTKIFPDGSWPRQLVGPNEGNLDEDSLFALVQILPEYQGHEDCYFYFDLMKTSDLQERLYFGPLSETSRLLKYPTLRETPTYSWPEDKSWCLFTDHDLSFTFLGGTNQIIEKILKSEILEALPARLEDRVDAKADQINKPISH